MAICKINDMYRRGKKSNIMNYSVEIEWVEDFSIIYTNAGKRKYESIHQVKARADKPLAAYEGALVKLLGKVKDNDEIDHAYLHVSKELSFEKESFKDSVNEITKKGTEVEKKIKIAKEYRRADTKEKKELLKKIYGPGANSMINSLIIEYNKKWFHHKKITVNEVDDILDRIIKEL